MTIYKAALLILTLLVHSSHAATRISYSYWAAQWLTLKERSHCEFLTSRAPPNGRCGVMAECIFKALDEYPKVGLASGTTILGLVPAALALIPSRRIGVEKVYREMGFVFLLLTVFCGGFRVGEAAERVGRDVEGMYRRVGWQRRRERGEGEREEEEAKEEEETLEEEELLVSRWCRYAIMLAVSVLAGIAFWLMTSLGLQTLVSWACNHEFLHMGWLLCRMMPGLVELVLVLLLRRLIKKNPALCKWGRGSRAWILAKFINGLSLALTGLVLIYGIGLFGSTNLIDGAEVIWSYLLLLPCLYFLMQALLAMCMMRRAGEHDGIFALQQRAKPLASYK